MAENLTSGRGEHHMTHALARSSWTGTVAVVAPGMIEEAYGQVHIVQTRFNNEEFGPEAKKRAWDFLVKNFGESVKDEVQSDSEAMELCATL